MPPGRRCLDCPRIGRWTRGRCPDHDRARDRARGTRQERGYDAPHDRLRAHYQRRMDAGETFTCARCGQPVDPTDWDLGHTDARTAWTGPEHRSECNRSAAGRKGAAISNRER